MRGYRPAILATAMVLGGCRYGPDDFARAVRTDPETDLSWVAPPAPDAAGEPLYQLLYKDEFGAAARPAGQRARMLAWIRWMELEQEALSGLSELVAAMGRVRAAEASDRASVALAEDAHLTPVYGKLIEALAADIAPDAPAWTQWSAALAEGHSAVGADGDPHQRQQARVDEVLKLVSEWMRTLHPYQIRRASDARFFLRRRLGPLVNPSHYGWVVGSHWDAGDFDTLRYLRTEDDPPHMDIGGLWRSEAYRIQPAARLRVQQAQVILAVAVSEPGLVEAIEVRQGTRAPLDFDSPALDFDSPE
jgi:hypothetical protein